LRNVGNEIKAIPIEQQAVFIRIKAGVVKWFMR
jgi:hypothetical protein